MSANPIVVTGTIVTVDADRRILEGGSVCIADGIIEAVLARGEALPAGFAGAATIRTRCGSPRYGTSRPSSSGSRSSSRALVASWRSR